MAHIIGIDPGTTWSALALLDPAARTVRFASIPSNNRSASLREALVGVGEAVAVVEGQQIRYGSGEKIPAQDIVDLALEAGRLAGLLEGAGMAVSVPKPQEWKGSVPKAVHNARIEARLARDGWEVAWGKIPPSMRNHYLDAAGMALWRFDLKI